MTVGLSNQLIIPFTLWGNRAPTHHISCIHLCKNLKTLITGCNDGQLLVWDFVDVSKLIPRCMLFSHSSRLLCLSNGTVSEADNLLVSSSEDGEMCLWDLTDGKCIESVHLQYVHTNIQPYLFQNCDESRLVCNGFYSEILVLDTLTFEIVFTLASRVCPDWISALDILNSKTHIMALNISGFIKVWNITGFENRSCEPIYEQESKQIRCRNATSLTCCPLNNSLCLVVSKTSWEIYDSNDFTLLCATKNIETCGGWQGGRFISSEQIIVWTDTGKAYLYQLPTNCITSSKDFHQESSHAMLKPYLTLTTSDDERLLSPPVVQYYSYINRNMFIRGDSLGRVSIWFIKKELKSSSEQFIHLPDIVNSLQQVWEKSSPVGTMDLLSTDSTIKITSSVYLPLQATLVIGREDGSIIIMSSIASIKHTLFGCPYEHSGLLLGHNGKVTCLLYPYHYDSRYDIKHLLSGGDFSVCLWDLYGGTLLRRFTVHAGVVTRLLVPPKDCTNRVLNSICSVASDNSVALLNLKDEKCIMLASRHIFPVSTIKWRPLDDYMVVGCSDGSVYVWQMETGMLDRVIHGMLGEDVLNACDEHLASSSPEDGLTNPAIHLFRGIKSRNLAAIKLATARGFRQIAGQQQTQKQDIVDLSILSRSQPLMIQGLKTNYKDQDSHVLFFDVECLIVNLLSTQYGSLSPGTLESQGLTANTPYQKYVHLSSPESSHKLTKLFVRVKDSAGNAAQRIQSVGFSSGKDKEKKKEEKQEKKVKLLESNLGEKISQILMSLLHAWGLNSELDKICEEKLGLIRPIREVCYGLLSKNGKMGLLLPSFVDKFGDPKPDIGLFCRIFYAKYHWELSSSLTTNHLLTIVSMANTFISMNSVSLLPDYEKRKSSRKISKTIDKTIDLEEAKAREVDAIFNAKQGWSHLATLHCVILPSSLNTHNFKRPLLDILAKRWQDKCLEIREASQALLLAELKRIGPKGRKQLADDWAPHIHQFEDILPHSNLPPETCLNQDLSENISENLSEDEEEKEKDERRASNTIEGKKKTSTAIILLGVIGSEYGSSFDGTICKNPDVVDGFTATNHTLARRTAHALVFLLLSPQSKTLPIHAPIRRAAIDLIGRGFVVWEAYLDRTKVLLALLELCCDIENTVPTMSFYLPLIPAADSCRAARHALSWIATSKPSEFITTLAQEVTRYNNQQQNSQSSHITIAHTVFNRSKPEILRNMELLIEKKPTYVSDLLIETMEIILHCLDPNHLKNQGLFQIFPPISKFSNISYCSATKRIAAGAKNGSLAIYETKSGKPQIIIAHNGPITCISFSMDGRHLATYSMKESRLCFWSTGANLFGLGNSQPKFIKSIQTPVINGNGNIKLVWTNAKNVLLLISEKIQYQYSV